MFTPWLDRFLRNLAREILIVAAAGLLLLFLYDKVVTLGSRASPGAPTIRTSLASVGTPVTIKNASFDHPLSILLITSPTCPFCLKSGDFHRSLLAEAQRYGFPMYVAVPDLNSAANYLHASGLEAAKVKPWTDVQARFRGTPTLLFIDSRGLVGKMWVGALNRQQEGEAFNAVKNPSRLNTASAPTGDSQQHDSATLNLTMRDLESVKRQRSVVVIDIRERADFATDHVDGVINIPLGELGSRAMFELNRSDLQVLDCAHMGEKRCSGAVEILTGDGFHVATLNAGLVVDNYCQSTAVN